MLHKLKKIFLGWRHRPSVYPVVVHPPRQVQPKGRVLLSYLEYPLLQPDHSALFLGHSNNWESKAIAEIFLKLGYQVEAINFSDRHYQPTEKIDVIFDIFANLGRLAPYLGKGSVKFLHCSGSDPYYQNAAELKRVAEVNQRRGGFYSPKRVIAEPELTYISLEVADACSLIGNEHTRRTYPEKYWHKMQLVTVSASVISEKAKEIKAHVPHKREFLWFFGSGAVHKGLDLLLEVFANHPKLHLHIVGNIADEKDFFELYQKELTATENIHYHGFLLPASQKFQKLLENIFCFVAPTCSEAISTAVVTCLQLGLYPIISRDTGITLPEKCGLYIENLTIDEVEKLILAVMELKDDEIIHQTQLTQTDALAKYSREAFKDQMEIYIVNSLVQFRT